MLNAYETVFILTPVLSEEQVKDATSEYRKFLTQAGCKVVSDEAWGLKKLAFPVRKKSTGFYQLFQFQGEGKVIAGLELTYKRDERLLRFLTVKLDRNAIAYEEKRKAKAKKKAETPVLK